MTPEIIISMAISNGLMLCFAVFLHQQNKRLRNLRRNAFLTDERGVRVKYANASREVRERAEREAAQ